MAELRVEGKQIKKLLTIAKRQPISFGFNPANPDENGYLALHRKKTPTVLGKAARSEGDGPKFTFGTASLKGKLLSLTCERDIPSLAKKVKKYLKSQKVVLNIEILDADGNLLDSDIEDDLPDDPDLEARDGDQEIADGDDNDDDDSDTGPVVDTKALTQRLVALKPEIEAVQGDIGAKLQKAFANTVGQVKSGNLDAAATGIDRLEAALAKISANTAQDSTGTPAPNAKDQIQKLVAVLKKLKGEADGLADADARTNVSAMIGQAAEHLRAGDASQATTALTRIRDAIVEARKAGSPTPEQEDTSDTENPADIWIDAKGEADASLGPLMSHLASSTDPNLQRIARFGLNGVTKGNNTALMAALMGYNSASGDARAQRAKDVIAQIDAYSSFLASDPIIALCEDNPFGQTVSIRAPLTKALKRMKTSLAA
ncbi:hypothetical protein [Qingshengfaniella alkalisoli]|uniref:Uncharacterized protein n=1 Tax=Qingshengfaniella alkalisoli TaxID=2599296 RepID=A0A5B8IYX8_9RHOB|nr:hypothetical protein [Qingshengfaniella alkalisoli]QDY70783.1 hypothetical protein FPZ52_13800 [Qingshengfaniella alkalisoli]